MTVNGDLGGADIAYLSINNKVTWRDPVDWYNRSLPRYWRNHPDWVAYRADLMAMIDAANAE